MNVKSISSTSIDSITQDRQSETERLPGKRGEATTGSDRVDLYLMNHDGDLVGKAVRQSNLGDYPKQLLMTAAVSFNGSSTTLTDVEWKEDSVETLDGLPFHRNALFVEFNGDPIKYETRNTTTNETEEERKAIALIERDTFISSDKIVIEAPKHIDGPYMNLERHQFLPGTRVNDESVDSKEILKSAMGEVEQHVKNNNISKFNTGAALAATGWGGYH